MNIKSFQRHSLTEFISNYNISRACLLNRSPVPAVDLKSNRSGLWRHILEKLVVGWEDYVARAQTMSRDIIKLQLSQHFCCDIRHNFWCRPVYYKTLILWNSLIYTILKPCKWRHNPSQSSQRILACGSYSPYKICLGLPRHFYGFKIV